LDERGLFVCFVLFSFAAFPFQLALFSGAAATPHRSCRHPNPKMLHTWFFSFLLLSKGLAKETARQRDLLRDGARPRRQRRRSEQRAPAFAVEARTRLKPHTFTAHIHKQIARYFGTTLPKVSKKSTPRHPSPPPLKTKPFAALTGLTLQQFVDTE
jgi:hypothetical protein